MANVLIVDDDPDAAFVVQEMLSDAHNVFVANDVSQALEILTAEDIHVLVSDLRMPKIDGFRLIEAARVACPGLPAVVMSAYYDETDELAHQMARRYADIILAKPFPPEAIQGAVNQLIRG